MPKETKLNALKDKMTDDLVALMKMEKEREILESEIDKDKNATRTRHGMLEALTEEYFANIIQIAKEEEEIEKLIDL